MTLLTATSVIFIIPGSGAADPAAAGSPAGSRAQGAAARVTAPVTFQGKTARWWAARAVQARKDANARARTIRRLQQTVRARLSWPTSHWLDGAFLCIHRYEGHWQANTGNGYYGGLQMDRSFQAAHGAWAVRAFGTADRWPVSVQIAVAVNAWLTRGFGPWPNTRRMCGL